MYVLPCIRVFKYRGSGLQRHGRADKSREMGVIMKNFYAKTDDGIRINMPGESSRFVSYRQLFENAMRGLCATTGRIGQSRFARVMEIFGTDCTTAQILCDAVVQNPDEELQPIFCDGCPYGTEAKNA